MLLFKKMNIVHLGIDTRSEHRLVNGYAVNPAFDEVFNLVADVG